MLSPDGCADCGSIQWASPEAEALFRSAESLRYWAADQPIRMWGELTGIVRDHLFIADVFGDDDFGAVVTQALGIGALNLEQRAMSIETEANAALLASAREAFEQAKANLASLGGVEPF